MHYSRSQISHQFGWRKAGDTHGRGGLAFLRNYSWIAASVFFQSVAAAFSKQAGLTTRGSGFISIIWNPWYVAQIIALVFQAGCWIMALRIFPLSFAYPFMSLIFFLNVLTAWLIFHEQIMPLHVLGIIFIFSGVWVIGRGEK